jgi:hypothetical protein
MNKNQLNKGVIMKVKRFILQASLFFSLSMTTAHLSTGDSPQCRFATVTGVTKGIALWLEEYSVQAAVLSLGVWSPTYNFSSYPYTYTPVFKMNATGGAVAIWQYWDSTTFNTYIVAATLPFLSGYNGWTVTVLSTASENTAFEDYDVDIDDTGNIIATWTTLLSGDTVTRVRTATGSISGTWNAPVTMD